MLTNTKTLTQATDVNGAGLVTLDGGGAHQHFMLNNPVSYRLSGLRLTNGHMSGHGGAIFVNGATLWLENATLDNNEAVGGSGCGGAIVAANNAAVTLSQVMATNNRATYGGAVCTRDPGDTLVLSEFVAIGNQAVSGGGAIDHSGGALTVMLSLFANNSITLLGATGGAIAVGPPTTSTLAISNSTFQGNTGGNGTSGSALSMVRVPSGIIENSTFADNFGSSSVIGAFTGTTVTLKNTIVSSTDGGPHPNCLANTGSNIVDGGHNLQFGGSVPPSCGASVSVADPLLAPLASNGGFSQTMALRAGSPAINAGNGCTAFDQRGVTRPIGPACDIGAFEAPLAPPPSGGVTAVPALGNAGLAVLSALVAGAGILYRRRRA